MPRRVGIAASLALLAAISIGGASGASGAVVIKEYKNCTVLNRHYPHGVGRKGAHDKVSGSTQPVTNFKVDTKLYRANKKSDRDGDGIACEKH